MGPRRFGSIPLGLARTRHPDRPLAAAADVANYYNCHRLTVLVPPRSAAQEFFEACGYPEEAVLPQHSDAIMGETMAAKKTTAKKATAKKAPAKKAPAKKAPAKKTAPAKAAAPGDRMTSAAGKTRGLGQRLVKAGEKMEKVADKMDALAERVKNRPRLLKRRKK